MSAFVRDKDFYKQLITISVPISLQNLISFGLSMMDTVMLGSLGEKQISASAIANQPYFICRCGNQPAEADQSGYCAFFGDQQCS